jgi:serine/threonine-protein kinase
MLKARERLGKYRIVRRIARGGFADVYRALDTVEGIQVALKVPQPGMFNDKVLEDFQKEVRLSAQLDHPNILPIKNADYVEGLFVVVYPLGKGTLASRMKRRLPFADAIEYAGQILDGVACAHEHRMIHCDVKPENLILFPGNRLRLTDFGLARLEWRAMTASGSGTIGYMAPEQAMGKPSYRSDVFSIGLVMCEMLFGHLPRWPFEWPPEGLNRAKRRLHPDLVALLRRSIEIDERKRFRDAVQMRAAFRRLRPRALAFYRRKQPRRKRKSSSRRNWKEIRGREFLRRFGRTLEVKDTCRKCGEPMSERMRFCPWCGTQHKVYRGETAFPAQCSHCGRGVKLDWKYCPWCYGGSIGPLSSRAYTDVRYDGRCRNPKCVRKDLIPFMRYCPWCRTKVRKAWKIPGTNEKCPSCGWGVLGEFWEHCPWCGQHIHRHAHK